MKRRSMLALGLAGALCAAGALAADTAGGNLSYKGRTTALKFAYFVTGPSDMDPGRTVRRLVLSATDIGARLSACKTFSCTDGEVSEGATVDFVGGPRLNYWIAMNGQKVQYSGTATPDAFSARGNDPARLAGRLAIDDTAAGGAKLDADVDVPLLKEFKAAR